MAFPRKLLGPGEEIVVEARPNWSVLVWPTTIAAVVIAGCIAILVVWSSAPLVVGYIFAGISVLAFVWYLAQIVEWRSRLLVITTSRVVYRWGVIRRTGREIPLDRVQDVTYQQSFIERLAGAGSLTIESAGSSGQEPFPDVRHPAELQSLINQLLSGDREAWRRQSLAARAAGSAPPTWGSGQPRPGGVEPTTAMPPVAPSPAPPPTGTQPSGAIPASGALAEQLRDLERLHESGVLTDDEFDRHRRSLLNLE